MITTAQHTFAQWSNDPTVNTPICTATGDQFSPTIVSDGSQGAIITWIDRRSGTNSDIYAQRIFSDGALPVELVSFTAGVMNGGVELLWKTATEVNNYGFEVERSKKSEVGSHNLVWEKIGFVEGHGNSNSPKEYTFVDKNILSGKYSYRLKQIDTDGSFTYSQIVDVEVGLPSKDFVLLQNHPNPFNPSTVISFQLAVGSHITLKVFDVLGREVETLLDEELEAGTYERKWNASNLPSGVYFYQLRAGSFVETKKLVLMK